LELSGRGVDRPTSTQLDGRLRLDAGKSSPEHHFSADTLLPPSCGLGLSDLELSGRGVDRATSTQLNGRIRLDAGKSSPEHRSTASLTVTRLARADPGDA
jgi:hypothetical protein